MSKTDDDTDGGRRQAERSSGHEPKHEEEELLADLRRVARTVSGTVSEREYADRGAYGVTTFRRRFGSWNAAKHAAGLEAARRDQTAAAMRDDVARVADAVDDAYVTPETYTERGDYPLSALPADDEFWEPLRDRVGLAVVPLRRKAVGNHESESESASEPEATSESGASR